MKKRRVLVIDDERAVRETLSEILTDEGYAVTAVSSVKTMRHLLSNLVVDRSGEGRATLLGVISFYGAAAKPPVSQSKPPMLIADLINECVREGDTWQFQSHTLRPVFMSDEAPLSIAIDTRR